MHDCVHLSYVSHQFHVFMVCLSFSAAKGTGKGKGTQESEIGGCGESCRGQEKGGRRRTEGDGEGGRFWP